MLAYQRQPSHHHLSQPADISPALSHSQSLRYYFPDSYSLATGSNLTIPSSSSPSQSSSSSLSPSVANSPRRQLDFPTSLATANPSFPSTALDGSQSNLADNTYMTSTYDFSNPSIRVQHPTPAPQLTAPYASSPLSGVRVDNQNWSMYASNNNQLGRSGKQGHQRGTSSSSVGSNGSSVQFPVNYPYVSSSCETSPSRPQIKLESYQTADQAQRPYSTHLPTPSQTPTQDTFLASTFPTYSTRPSPVESNMVTQMALKQAMMDQNSAADDDVPSFGHSARHSVSSYGHDSPATPHTTHGDDFDDKYRMASGGEGTPRIIPKLARTMTDIFRDELYNPADVAHLHAPQTPQQPQHSNPAMLSPYRNVVSERLHQAEQLRSQSPSSSMSRDASPFRQGAGVYEGFGSPNPTIRTASAMRGQQQGRNEAFAMKSAKMDNAEPKTISPKESLLTYDDNDSQMPLFPTAGNFETQFGNGAGQNLAGIDTAAQNMMGADSLQASPAFTFTQQPTMAFTSMPQFNNSHHNYRAARSIPSRITEPTPDFPAHLTSMESSASEAGPPDSSQSSEVHRPESTLADSGTYSCTYHGCLLRFDTPQKLQRHKREAHRNAANPPPEVPTVSSGMTSEALLARNSQAGPHKCERINPTTGKPCNTIFSRPYDLTRHEDTIHNARKQKVRCALCTDEKTFSRSDALTRHMRVVHPDVDFPGKNRRRGGNHE